MVGCILFWNLFFMIVGFKILVVLVFGNIVIMKVVDDVLLMILLFVEVCNNYLFVGVVNVLIGWGSVVG